MLTMPKQIRTTHAIAAIMELEQSSRMLTDWVDRLNKHQFAQLERFYHNDFDWSMVDSLDIVETTVHCVGYSQPSYTGIVEQRFDDGSVLVRTDKGFRRLAAKNITSEEIRFFDDVVA
jgi:hypothetical protein